MDNLLQEMGVCGRFQICHVTVVQMCRFVTAWTFSVMIFGLYDPGWRCVQHNNGTSSRTLNDLTNVSATYYPGWPNARIYDGRNTTNFSISLRTVNHRSKKNSLYDEVNATESQSYEASCDVIKSCDGVEFNPASSTIVTEFDLVCDKVWIAYIIISILNVGMLLGALAWGEIGERWGRKVGLYGSTFIMTLGCGLAVFSPVWQVYAFFTFFIGFGAIGAVSTSSTLSMEFLSSKWRARLGSVPVWNISVISFALITFVLRDWRYIHLASTCVAGLACLAVFWTPESMRWQLLHGKSCEAEKVMAKIARCNNKPVPKETFHSLLISSKRDTDEDEKDKKYTSLDLFRRRDLCILTIKIGTLSVAIQSVYDIIGFGIQSLPGDFYTNIIVASLIEFPSTLTVGPLATRIGRRWTGVLYEVVGVICCSTIVVSLLALHQSPTRDILITTMAFVNRSIVQATLGLMMAYTAELVPTAVRNLFYGFFHIMGRLAGIVGPFLIPRDFPSMVICFTVLMVCQVIATAIFLSLPETKNRPIDDALQSDDAKNRSA